MAYGLGRMARHNFLMNAMKSQGGYFAFVYIIWLQYLVTPAVPRRSHSPASGPLFPVIHRQTLESPLE